MSIHGSEMDSQRSSMISLQIGDRRQSAKQIIIEDASSHSLNTSRLSKSEQSLNEQSIG